MFFTHASMQDYSFGPNHPLKPIRLARTLELVRAHAPDIEFVTCPVATFDELELVHDREYIETVQGLSLGQRVDEDLRYKTGFLSGDNPPFLGMYDAAIAYSGGSIAAARAIIEGGQIAFNIGGGLHHARPESASGFCVFNDCALACSILKTRFERVAYVDIDLHHGDGVQHIFYDDASVLTCSIHESGKFLYPGTGFEHETGKSLSSLNVPLEPMTTGDTWLWAIESLIIPSLKAFQPQAIVLQMGADPHFSDPLGHLQVTAQEWVQAVKHVVALGIPIVALGGGGYSLSAVPRMWLGAIMTLLGKDIPPTLVTSSNSDWGFTNFEDSELPQPRWQGLEEAHKTQAKLKRLGFNLL